MPVSRERFVECLSAAGLMSDTEITALDERTSADPELRNTDALARELVRLGKLTKYQAAAIYQEKGSTLVLGNYVIIDKLGAGGMGQVFRARHRKMDRVVALKLLPKKALSSPDAVERFQREVKAAARLVHSHIVTALDADEAGGTHFLVMEYIEGSDLSGLVKKEGPLPIATAVSYILQAARGLEHAHAEGVIHRDIKPSNLLVDKRGIVKILDLGLARFSEAPDSVNTAEVTGATELTQAGNIMGTVDYMAPEQAVDTRQADERADVYSLGCTLCYLLTARPPFAGDTVMGRLVAHRDVPIPSLRKARPEVPEALDVLFRRMLAKRPADRPQSMTEVIAALERVTAPKQAAAKRWRLPVALGGGAVVAAAAVVVAMLAGGDDEAAAPTVAQAKASPVVTVPQTRPPTPPVLPTVEARAEATKLPSATQPKPNPPAPHPAEEPPAVKAPVRIKETPTVVAQAAAPPEPAKPAPIPTAQPVPGAQDSSAQTPAIPADKDGPAPVADSRQPVPGASAQQAALETIKSVFAEEYAGAKLPDGKATLAQKLLKQVEESADDPAARYVLLREARDLAAELVDTSLIDKTTAALAASYQVDAIDMQVEIYQKLLPKARLPAASKELAETLLALADRAVEGERFGPAEQFVKLAASAAGKARDGQLVKLAKTRGDEIATQKQEAEAFHNAEAKLAQSPDDPDASLAVGKHLCFIVRNWDAGLPHLAKGSDATLKSLATASLDAANQAAALVGLGDRWWEAAEKAKVKEKASLRDGTRHWYSMAQLTGLTGLAKTKVQKRLAELGGPEDARQVASAVPTAAGTPPRVGPSKLPPAAVAPFNADQAKALQALWSNYLRVPVEAANSIGMKLVLIPPGEFLMGAPPSEIEQVNATAATIESVKSESKAALAGAEAPQHRVRLSRPFFLGATEVTQAQYLRVMTVNPSGHCSTGPVKERVVGVDTQNFAVENVSWEEAVAFCTRLAEAPEEKATGRTYRLPTEAEWEFSCRAGTTSAWSWGDNPSTGESFSWLRMNGETKIHAVAQKSANPFGLFDMHGNVHEWCADYYADDAYRNSPGVDPTGPASGQSHVYRGGRYWSLPIAARSAYRCTGGGKYFDRGFRVVCVWQ